MSEVRIHVEHGGKKFDKTFQVPDESSVDVVKVALSQTAIDVMFALEEEFNGRK